ncbi:MAG: hypothetical protein E5Y35_13390 [Mesorhizobium sp.]|nr:MAG: hypothetical protein E5X19_02605 [Mesorhizobium sp.]TJV09827.1 MAG: hypothetical protein E5Y35_13390 [Mesorhizobium sp.]
MACISNDVVRARRIAKGLSAIAPGSRESIIAYAVADLTVGDIEAALEQLRPLSDANDSYGMALKALALHLAGRLSERDAVLRLVPGGDSDVDVLVAALARNSVGYAAQEAELRPRPLGSLAQRMGNHGERMESKDLDETMASARQTIAQVESVLREGRKQLGRQTEFLGDNAVSGDAISASVAAQGADFRQAYPRERPTVVGDIVTATSQQQPIFGPRVELTWQRV